MEIKEVIINDVPVLVHVYREARRTVRFSIGKKGLHLRMPRVLTEKQQQQELEKMLQWAEKQYQNHPALLEKPTVRSYQSGDTLTVGSRQYTLKIHPTHNSSHSAQLIDGVIYCRLSTRAPEPQRQERLRGLLSRVVAADFLPDIYRRVFELNQQTFQKPIGQVRLKYNQSNWGSCSAKGNINLSTRLLFAPPEVIDYVIVHELAHRVEMNHSKRFWQLVANAIPRYKEHEKWLKQHGSTCNF